jgi:acyl transferase domain-containing protein
MLQVNLAYHSNFMAEIAANYNHLLLQNCETPLSGKEGVTMFSSVTGHAMDVDCDDKYWKRNMVSPVRFDEAVREMVSGRDGADFLIEIGPSGALAGPISQIKKALGGQGNDIQYCAASSRGADSIKALFDVTGKLFIAGGPVDLTKVNEVEGANPSVIVDLPNYVWNHSTKYWHESEASKDWRFRCFPHHDLLGSKVLGTSWHSPAWKKVLKVENLTWLKDHKVGLISLSC